MKKIFKNNLFHYTFVLTVVALVCGILIGGVNAITAPIIEENIKEAQAEAYRLVLPQGQTFSEPLELENVPTSILSVVEGNDASGNVIGYIYTAFGNNQHGSIRIVVSVDPDGTIIGTNMLEIQQTKGLDLTTYHLSLFNGTDITALTPDGDITAGVTNSLNTIKALLTDIATVHASLDLAPTDPYIAWFGIDYTKETDATFSATEHVVSKDIIEDSLGVVIGYLYKVTGYGIYETDNSTEKDVAIYVGLSTNGTILGVLVPSNEYHHSAGGLYDSTVSFLETFVGTNIADVEITGSDLTAGATNSKTLMNELMAALKEVATA